MGQCDIGKYETVEWPQISTPCPSNAGGSPTGNMGVYVWKFVCISIACFFNIKHQYYISVFRCTPLNTDIKIQQYHRSHVTINFRYDACDPYRKC